MGKVLYKAIFESSSSGIQINLDTGKRRALRPFAPSQLFAGELERIVSEPEEESSELTAGWRHAEPRAAPMHFASIRSELRARDSISTISVLFGSWKCVATTGLE